VDSFSFLTNDRNKGSLAFCSIPAVFQQVISSAAPTKLFRTEYTFYRDAGGRPTNIHEIKRRRDNGTYQVTALAYDVNGQLASVTPQEVSPADGLRLVRATTRRPRRTSASSSRRSSRSAAAPTRMASAASATTPRVSSTK
jgi:hypothetical protein